VQARPGGYRPELAGELQGTTSIDAPSFAGLAEVWLEQRLGVLRLKAGQIDLSTEVGMLEPAGEFLNPSFGVSPTQMGFPTFPDPRPGVIGALEIEGQTLRVAAFSSRPGARPPDYGVVELDLRRGSVRAAAGAWQHRSVNGAPRQGMQLVAERRVVLSSGRLLDAYIRYGRSGQGLGVREHHAAGVVSNRFGREADLAGLAWTHVAVAVEAGRLHESIAELFYAWRATPWLELRPDLQLVHGPGGRGAIATMRVSISH
jgi:hypothetical protein